MTRRTVGVELEAEIAERRAVAVERQAALAKKLAKLSDERQKLLSAFHANAIPLELLKDEQDCITTQERAAKYEKDIKISNQQMAAVNLTRHDFHGDWNYTINPGPPSPPTIALTTS